MTITDITPETDAKVRAVPQRIVKAWAENDAEAFGDVFTEDGSLILPNNIFLTSRKDIREFMAKGFAGPYKGTRVTGEPIDVKYLARNIAVVITKGGVLAPGETEVAPERAIRAMWVLKRRDRQWLIECYQNTPIGA
jgi:uncharacterized protein (TIGR02246 family)